MSARCKKKARGGKHVGAVIIRFGFWREERCHILRSDFILVWVVLSG
jgi:hypothetical protein